MPGGWIGCEKYMSISGSTEILPASTADAGLIFAVDLGGTYHRAAAVDSEGAVISRMKLRTPQTGDPQDIVRVLAGALTECQREVDQIRALSIVVPGPVDAKAGKGIRAGTLADE